MSNLHHSCLPQLLESLYAGFMASHPMPELIKAHSTEATVRDPERSTRSSGKQFLLSIVIQGGSSFAVTVFDEYGCQIVTGFAGRKPADRFGLQVDILDSRIMNLQSLKNIQGAKIRPSSTYNFYILVRLDICCPCIYSGMQDNERKPLWTK